MSLVVMDIALAFWTTLCDARINSAYLHFYVYTLYLKTVCNVYMNSAYLDLVTYSSLCFILYKS